MSKQFSQSLGLDISIADLATAHGDKCHQYQFAWDEANITFGKGCLVYLLSYVKPFSDSVRHTPFGFVEPCKWVIEQATQDGPVKDVLAQLPSQVTNVDVGRGHSEFHVYVDGGLKYKAVREQLKQGGKTFEGFWILSKMLGTPVRVDRDKYSNDLMECIKSGNYDNITSEESLKS